MNQQQLFDAAEKLVPVSAETARNYADHQYSLAAAVSRLLIERQDIERLIGTGNQAMMEDNHRNHARFIASLLESFDARVLVESILWVFRAYRNHGFQLTYWPAQLDAWLRVLQQQLTPAAYTEIEHLYRFMLFYQPAFAALSDSAVLSPSKEPCHD